MSAILGLNIGGRRLRSRSPSPARSGYIVGRADSPPGFRGRGPQPVVYRMAAAAGPRRNKKQTPQEAVDEFWAKFTAKTPGKATRVIPQRQQGGERAGENGGLQRCNKRVRPTSYQEAAAKCRAKVAKIVGECRRVNKKYRDSHFDIESDLKLGRRECLQSLQNVRHGVKVPGSELRPRSAKRVTDIFDKPQLYIDGPTANDVRQGRDGDCWLMAALCTLSNKKGLIERLCVAYDQEVGVYGFVFHRDGEWISEIVDDFLYLTKSDYDESYTDRVLFDELERVNAEEAYRRIYQSNSGALYFAQCEHPQETWLPLLEKCYAKAHGDYAAIEGGFGGEGIEDLTGGVTSEMYISDILDKEYFWKEELLKVNKDFLFGCSTGVWGSSKWGERKGIMELHSYSVQKAVEIEGKRLVRLKNPWGKGEWKGAWSDGSKEWTAEWLAKLEHRFGDDGDFWISYQDLLRKFQAIERVRLFDHGWLLESCWTTLAVPWVVDYHDTYFRLSISARSHVVLVLSQLDERYFRGLEGQYQFELALRLHHAGQEDYIVRSQAPYRMRRSVNAELELEAGHYDVRVKIDATRNQGVMAAEQVVHNNAKERREKLTRIGLAYDLAHAKGKLVESPQEKDTREAHEKKQRETKRQEARDKIRAEREKEYYLKKKAFARGRERQRKMAARQRERLAAKRKTAAAPEAAGQALTPGCESDSAALDMDSLSDLSERELDIRAEVHLAQGRTNESPSPSRLSESPDEFESDPWNAVAVVGLHVYYHVKDADPPHSKSTLAFRSSSSTLADTSSSDCHNGRRVDDKEPRAHVDAHEEHHVVRLAVMRPNPLAQRQGSKALDVDDSARDATLSGAAIDGSNGGVVGTLSRGW
ncbi:hypothetical protein CDD81_3149 [Ophiocordyceps australis]|uniref:Calpain catalytic domain-containing protein n=1 Tax=Ophiocordyceps australis TaxID=1399860 RepID=A0A2C5X7D7_9HYPO|nr:hypothetical protein CDD81_3149 [Ophiocordyceps australis]